MLWRKWKFWLALIAAATLIGAMEGAQLHTGTAALGYAMSWPAAFASTVPSWYVMVALVPLVLFLSRRFRIVAGRWPLALAVYILAGVVFAIVHIALSLWIGEYLLQAGGPPPNDFTVELTRLLTAYFVLDVVTYFALVVGYHAWMYALQYREEERAAAAHALNASRLEASLARANLESLRMQLNPHFLFNTLNAISVMALKGERQGVVRMLTLLSDLLRYSLEHRQHVVPLREELHCLELYLEIEQVRFRDRLSIERDIHPDVLDAEVPALLLQPLVENAIKHGITQRAGPGTVRVEARVDGAALEVRVADTGPGFGQSRLRDGTGVGLANTRARLEQLYGSEQKLDICNPPEGGACVIVRLPYRLIDGERTGHVHTATA